MKRLSLRKAFIGLVAAGVAVLLFVMFRGRALPVEMTTVTKQTVREYIAEDAKTRLADTFTVDMPLTGTIERIRLKEGDRVDEGACIAAIDPFQLQQQITEVESSIAQARARITGVDVAKPKPEDLKSAELRARESATNTAAVAKERDAANVALENAKKEYDRLKTLVGEGVVSQSQFDAADRTYKQAIDNVARLNLAESASDKAREVAELASKRLAGSTGDNEFQRRMYLAEIDGLNAQLDSLKNDLKKATITSPVTGLVLEKYVEDQRVLTAGTPLLKLGDLNTIEIECDVLSEEIGRVAVGDAVEIAGKALSQKAVTGTVDRIYPAGFKKISALGIEQQRVKTIIRFDNKAAGLRPGTSVDARIITAESRDAIAVPERATFRYENGWAVFQVENGRARLTKVDVGLKNDVWAEIRSGLAAGATIVAEPKNELKDGMRVASL